MWLWESMTASGALRSGSLHDVNAKVALAEFAHGSIFANRLEDLRGRVVVISTRDQLTAALALIELDGVAKRMVLCPPELSGESLSLVVGDAEADAWVGDLATGATDSSGIEIFVTPSPRPVRSQVRRTGSQETEWALLTSGTLGAPKLVLHTLASLTSAFARRTPFPTLNVWSTFYDIRRYGGLQILLRALHSGSLVLSNPAESVNEFLARAGAAGVTHISGTPSHWRRALMSGASSLISPQYVRLSGEIADQSVLDILRVTYPKAHVGHAFASTEAGVAFEVCDGYAGFPAGMIGVSGEDVEIKIAEGTMRIRSAGNATRYLGNRSVALRDRDGFVDTGDRVELRSGRYHFVGRTGGVINVGGLKVHPEEVESIINTHPWVQMSLVKARRNSITGAVATADVVIAVRQGEVGKCPDQEELKRDLFEMCRRALAPHKVPAMIRFVRALEVSVSGKLDRTDA